MKLGKRKSGKKEVKRTVVICLLLTAISLAMGCSEKVAPGSEQVKRQKVSGVSLAKIAPSQVDEFYETGGTIKAASISYVASRVMGTVKTLYVKEGDKVQAGQLLLTIDDRDLVQKVKAAEANYREAAKALEASGQNRALRETTSGRYRKMFEEKAISRQEMDEFETRSKVAGLEEERMRERVDAARAGLTEAEIYLGFTRITSPVKGTITEKKIDAGSMAVPGAPLFTLESTSDFNAEVSVDERLAGKLRLGSPATVFIDALKSSAKGVIREILPGIDPLSRTFLIKIGLQGRNLKTGLYARVRIPVGKKEVLLAPVAALVEKGQLTGLFTADDEGIITYRVIRTGQRYGDHLEILSGLDADDRVVVKGVEKAVDGGLIVMKTNTVETAP